MYQLGSEPNPEVSSAPVLNHEYLSRRYAQLFMSQSNIHLSPQILSRINQYIVLAVNELFEDEDIHCPPTRYHLESALELRMMSNTTYHHIMRSIPVSEKPLMFHSPRSKTNSKLKHTSLSLFMNLGLFKQSAHLKEQTDLPNLSKRKTALTYGFSSPSLVSLNIRNEPGQDHPAGNPTSYNKTPTRTHVSMIAPWQVMYYCSMSDAYNSQQLLAHIEMAGAVLNNSVAQFFGTFVSQLIQAVLQEVSWLARVRQLASVTLPILEEVFHPRDSQQLPKFPIFFKLKPQVEKALLVETSLNPTTTPKVTSSKESEEFVPMYLSKSSAEKFLQSLTTSPNLSAQGLFLVNRFLDEVVLGLANKLSLTTTLPQLQAALNLTLKCCPLVIRSFHKLEKALPSLMAVPVRPLLSESSTTTNNNDRSKEGKNSSSRGHHYRLITHYFSPFSDLYQSRKLSSFFLNQPLTLDTDVSRYLAAMIGQLGQEILKLGVDGLSQDKDTLITSTLTTHHLVPALAGALPHCAISTRLRLFQFPHVDTIPQQIPRSPESTVPSLRTSQESDSSAASSHYRCPSPSPNVNPHPTRPQHPLHPSIALPQLGLGFLPATPSPPSEDLLKFDAMLESETTLHLSLTPNHITSID